MNFEQKYNEVLSSLASERQQNDKLKKDLENIRIHFSELEATNNHLIAATWRERDLKKKLSETLAELHKTKELVENQNKRITESINYARKIQLAINPSENNITEHFPQSFILYKPKDVISGDFPWYHAIDDYLYLAAVDCTGHGVPGAMLSMIGNLLLNNIISNGKIVMPSEILKKLHVSVVQTLKQEFSNSNSNDGMDIGLCRINKTTGEIIFSGAHRPLFLLHEGIIQTFPGDKFPIGGLHYRGKNEYTDHKLRYEPGDAIFLFTDGLPDQVGGPESKKVMTRAFKEFLEKQSVQSAEHRKSGIQEFYNSWKGSHKQIDDVLVIGIHF